MDLLPRILVVEEDANFARVLGSHLRRNGFVVQSVHSNKEARTALVDGSVDVVLAGVRRPDAAGLQACAEVVALAQGAPVFLMTSVEAEDLASHAIAVGLSGVFYKPVDFDAILHSLQTHIPRRPVARCLLPGQPVSVQILASEHVPATRGLVIRTTDEAFHVDLDDPLNADDRVEVTTPGDDAMYEFRSRVLGADDLGRFILSKPAILRRRQRRRHPRIPLVRPARIQQVSCGSEAEEIDTGNQLADNDLGQSAKPKGGISVQTTDVSLGGMSLMTQEEFEAGESVHIEWGEPGSAKSDHLRATGIVVRCERVAAPGLGSIYRVGVQFDRVPRNLRSSLQRYLSGSQGV